MNEDTLSSPSSGFFSPAVEEIAKEPLSFVYEAPHQWHSIDDLGILPVLIQDLQNPANLLYSYRQ